jgi:nucleoside-diphosphate-sugar epimerase
MKIIGITGYSGFVGANLIPFLNSQNQFSTQEINIRSNPGFFSFLENDSIIHLAGKAHDFKRAFDPEEYYRVNTELTKKVFDEFLVSDARIFITLSSVKAVADDLNCELSEQYHPNPTTHYGKSKLLAEQYIFSKNIPIGKRVYVLRPCIIHGPGNKGNLNFLYKFVTKNIPWPLGGFKNRRSFCGIDNLMFVIKELLEREDIPSGVYNVADDEALSTNEIISLIAQSRDRKPKIWEISKRSIEYIAALGDKLHLPLNTERLQKLTSSYIVSNAKIKAAIGKPLPVSSREGLLRTFKSFNCQ